MRSAGGPLFEVRPDQVMQAASVAPESPGPKTPAKADLERPRAALHRSAALRAPTTAAEEATFIASVQSRICPPFNVRVLSHAIASTTSSSGVGRSPTVRYSANGRGTSIKPTFLAATINSAAVGSRVIASLGRSRRGTFPDPTPGEWRLATG
jgi:hypothetical protein